MNFFIVANNLFDDSEYAIADSRNATYGTSPKCDECGGPIGSRRWLPEFIVKLSKKKFGDFVFGSVNPFLVTEKIVKIIHDNNINGIVNFNQVVVTNNQNAKLYFPEIKYGSLLIDEYLSGFVRSSPIKCKVCMLGGVISSYGMLTADMTTWDGLDIFRLKQLPGTIVLSDRFYDLCKENAVTNLSVKEMQDYYPPWMK